MPKAFGDLTIPAAGAWKKSFTPVLKIKNLNFYIST